MGRIMIYKIGQNVVFEDMVKGSFRISEIICTVCEPEDPQDDEYDLWIYNPNRGEKHGVIKHNIRVVTIADYEKASRLKQSIGRSIRPLQKNTDVEIIGFTDLARFSEKETYRNASEKCVDDSLDKIDAALFSGDVFMDRKNIKIIEEYIERWSREISSNKMLLDQIDDEENKS